MTPQPAHPPTYPFPSVTSGPSGRDIFEILATEHADMLAAYLRSLVADSHLVSDLFQETMLVAWRRLPDYDRSRPFGPWLRGIAANLVLEQRRKSARAMLRCDPAVLAELDTRFDRLAAMPGDSFRERADRLKACLDKLPLILRETIDLAYSRGLMLKQIAESLSANEEAVKKRLQRARALLARCVLGQADPEPLPASAE